MVQISPCETKIPLHLEIAKMLDSNFKKGMKYVTNPGAPCRRSTKGRCKIITQAGSIIN